MYDAFMEYIMSCSPMYNIHCIHGMYIIHCIRGIYSKYDLTYLLL